MPRRRTPGYEVNKRQKAAAIRVLAATVDDAEAPIYLRVMSARSLLAQPKPEPKPIEGEGESKLTSGLFVNEAGVECFRIEGAGVTITLPAKDRRAETERLEHLAEMEIVGDDDEPLAELPGLPPPRKLTGQERLRLIRERRRATRAAPYGTAE